MAYSQESFISQIRKSQLANFSQTSGNSPANSGSGPRRGQQDTGTIPNRHIYFAVYINPGQRGLFSQNQAFPETLQTWNAEILQQGQRILGEQLTIRWFAGTSLWIEWQNQLSPSFSSPSLVCSYRNRTIRTILSGQKTAVVSCRLDMDRPGPF